MRKLAKFLVAKLSVATIATCCYFTYANHDTIKRIMNNLAYSDVHVRNGFFKDPNGLEVSTEIDKQGQRLIYLKHEPSQRLIPISDDMYPDTRSMLETILLRTEHFDESAKDYLHLLSTIQEKIYEKL